MRILLVEDERCISAYVKRGLEEEGQAVEAVFTGCEAPFEVIPKLCSSPVYPTLRSSNRHPEQLKRQELPGVKQFQALMVVK
jgi:CheY-like chemotaxis protein